MPEKKTNPLALRIADDLKDALVRAAAADQRSISSFAQVILRKHLIDTGFLDQTAEVATVRKRGTRT